MLTLTVQQVHASAYRHLSSDPATDSTHCLILTGDIFGGTHSVVTLLGEFDPIISYGDVEGPDELLFFAPTEPAARELYRRIQTTLRRLPWHYTFGVWWRKRISSRFAFGTR